MREDDFNFGQVQISQSFNWEQAMLFTGAQALSSAKSRIRDGTLSIPVYPSKNWDIN